MKKHFKKLIAMVFVLNLLLASFLIQPPKTVMAATDVLVAFDPENGTAYSDFVKINVKSGGLVAPKPADPTKDGFVFAGWYHVLDENEQPVFWDFDKDTVDENMTLWAAWKKILTVAYDPDDGSDFPSFFKTQVPQGGLITEKPETPTKDGFIFAGWYHGLDENNKPIFWNFNKDTVDENITLWAAWTEAVTVVYDPDNGSDFPSFFKTQVPKGGLITEKPETPTKDGYVFAGWYHVLDENDKPIFWDFNKDTADENITLWAAWEDAIIITFDPQNGTNEKEFSRTTIAKGSKLTEPPENPTRKGYKFKGWYSKLDENNNPILWDFENGIFEKDMVLYASWEKDAEAPPSTGDNSMKSVAAVVGVFSVIVILFVFLKGRKKESF